MTPGGADYSGGVFTYMRAAPEHIPQIAAIERLCFSDPWSEESFKREFKDRLARYFIAAIPPGIQSAATPGIRPVATPENLTVVGYCGYWSVVGEAHITNIAVHPRYRRRGAGGGLIRTMLDDVAALGHKSATLEVRVDNHTAIWMYEKYNFKRAGVRKGYYDRGKTDAYIMWLYL